MGVEHGKKENRSEYGFQLTMKEFLDVRANYWNLYNHVLDPVVGEMPVILGLLPSVCHKRPNNVRISSLSCAQILALIQMYETLTVRYTHICISFLLPYLALNQQSLLLCVLAR